MPHIVKWEEKIKYVRPTVCVDLSFLTKLAEEKLENCYDLDEVVEELSSEVWFCEHMSNYGSPYVNKEVLWET